MKPLASEWASFDQTVVPVNVTDQQRYQMKVAFHAGATTALALVKHIVRTAESEADGARALDALTKECEQFVAQMEGGKS